MSKVALVTGAAAGIGKACAVRLSRDGHAVGVLDLDKARCADTVDEITAGGGKAVALAADITDRGQVRAALTELRDAFGPITVLVNNAGMAEFLPFKELTDGDALFEAVCQEVNRKAQGYFHSWKPTDMVIWDNWRVLHAVEGCDPKYERHMQRTTIKGDYGLGYFEGGRKIGEVDRDIAPLDLKP